MAISSTIGEQTYLFQPFPDDDTDPHAAENYCNISLARKHLMSIKKEVDCGTPIDPTMIEAMEHALERLENRVILEDD